MPTRPLIENPNDIRLNDQDEVQSLLGQAPGWMLRWGIPFVGLGVLILLLISAWVRYPDVITGRASILANNNPPIRVMAQRSGRISELLAKPGDTVASGQILGVLENAASSAEVRELETILAQFTGLSETSAYTLPPHFLQLGEIQTPYAALQRHIGEFLDARNETHTQKALQMLAGQIAALEASNQSLNRQVNTLKKEVELAERHATLMQRLYEAGANSEEDKERAEAAYLRYQRELEAKKAEILTNRLSITRIGSERLGLERIADERLRTEKLLLRESAATVSAAIQTWKQNHGIIAPTPGVVFAEGAWTAQQYIQAGEAAFTILPVGSSIASARTWIAPDGLGKVKPGAVVQLRLDAFPYKEYGILEGVVKNLAPVPTGNPQEQLRYLAEIELTGNLVTTYGIALPPQQEMPATARIITEKRSLLERIFDQFLDAVYNR